MLSDSMPAQQFKLFSLTNGIFIQGVLAARSTSPAILCVVPVLPAWRSSDSIL